jgi:DNA modification methylase
MNGSAFPADNWILFLGDANEIIPQHIQPNSIDLCFTSPSPYHYKGQPRGIGSESKITDYILNLVILFDNVKNVLKDDGNLFVNLVDPFSIDFGGMLFIPERIAQTMLMRGWICKGKIIWKRPWAGQKSDVKRFTVDWEYIYWLVKNRNSYFDYCNGDYGDTSIFDYKTQNGFPKDFIKMLVRSSSPQNGVVLDPLCSTGLTGEVALSLNRKFIGIEILEEKYKYAKTNFAKWT